MSRNNLRLDGRLQDATDNFVALFIFHYDGGASMIKTLAEKIFKMLGAFADAVLSDGYFSV